MGDGEHAPLCRRGQGWEQAGAEQFDYFMVRVVRSADEPGRVAGQVERLGTGEKRAFGTGDQLAELVAAWPDLQPERDR